MHAPMISAEPSHPQNFPPSRLHVHSSCSAAVAACHTSFIDAAAPLGHLILSCFRRFVHDRREGEVNALSWLEGRIMGIDELLGGHRKAVLDLAVKHGARHVRIFGSVARGSAGPTSDIDVLVSMDRGRSLLDLCALGDDLEDLLGRKVDILTEAAISPCLRDRILSEAIAL